METNSREIKIPIPDDILLSINMNEDLLIEEIRRHLAEQFNVQVFLTTHSKECIDAFIENGYRHEDITAFALREKEDGTIESKYVDGLRLASLLESINIDIRG